MTYRELLQKLIDLDMDTKIVRNTGGYSETEIKLFALDTAKTVRELVKVIINLIDPCLYDFTVEVNEKTANDIVYHDDHFKKYRFYEIVFEQ